jgi:hypothetical protein
LFSSLTSPIFCTLIRMARLIIIMRCWPSILLICESRRSEPYRRTLFGFTPKWGI